MNVNKLLELEDSHSTLSVDENDSIISIGIHEFSERAWFKLDVYQCIKLRDVLNKHIDKIITRSSK